MRIWVYVVLGLIAAMTVCMVLGAMKLERRATEWEWLHPPEAGETDAKDAKEADG